MKKYYIILLLIISNVATAYSFTYPNITEINPAIDSLMKQVDIDSLEYYIRYLQDLGPRPATTKHMNPSHTSGHLLYQNNIAAKKWLHQQYKNIGNLEVYFNHFLPESQCDTIWQYFNKDTIFYTVDTARNVVAVQKGTEYTDEYIMRKAGKSGKK